jgi:hypothetical protein
VEGLTIGCVELARTFFGLSDVSEDIVPTESLGVGFEGLKFLDGCCPSGLLSSIVFDCRKEMMDFCHAGVYLACFTL